MEDQGPVIGDRGLPCQTDHGEAVGAVGRDLELHDGVVQPQHLCDIIAGGEARCGEIGIGVQNEQPVGGAVGPVALVHAELGVGAAHADAFHAAQGSGFDVLAAGQVRAVEADGDIVADLLVLGAGDDLHRGVPADVDLADPHVVAVFMTAHFEDPADDDAADLRVQAFDGLHLGA